MYQIVGPKHPKMHFVMSWSLLCYLYHIERALRRGSCELKISHQRLKSLKWKQQPINLSIKFRLYKIDL